MNRAKSNVEESLRKKTTTMMTRTITMALAMTPKKDNHDIDNNDCAEEINTNTDISFSCRGQECQVVKSRSGHLRYAAAGVGWHQGRDSPSAHPSNEGRDQQVPGRTSNPQPQCCHLSPPQHQNLTTKVQCF
jgi:hypothetical protein